MNPIRMIVKDSAPAVEFDNGQVIDVWRLAIAWGTQADRLTGNRCMAPECDQEPIPGMVTVYGTPVGRVCDDHKWLDMATDQAPIDD